MFLLNEFNECPIMPSYPPNSTQLWIFYQQEPPTTKYWWRYYSCFDNMMNATMTFRKDSDIYAPRIRIERRNSTYKVVNVQYPDKTKPKMAAWFVSHCNTQSKREMYAKKLRRYIDLDIYGKCGDHDCPAYTRACDKQLKDTYNFYLSFENSICEDYVTEKLLRPLLNGVVPVTLGGADYTQILPEGSYIDVSNFTSPGHLALYLHHVLRDVDRYRSYFEWKKTHYVKNEENHINFCGLCKYVNENGHKRKIYGNLTEWFMKCTRPVDYYKVFHADDLADPENNYPQSFP